MVSDDLKLVIFEDISDDDDDVCYKHKHVLMKKVS